MSSAQHGTVTALLDAVRDGDREALNALFPLVYEQLHTLAKQKRQKWHGDYTLNTTALVNEAYLKLADPAKADWKSRAHFFAVAARVMRHILIDYAERRRTLKRGGDVEKVSLEEQKAVLEGAIVLSMGQADRLVALGEALAKLERGNERQGRVVECKFFCKMTNEETAEALGVSVGTVKRDWMLAKAWLHREVEQVLEPEEDGGAA